MVAPLPYRFENGHFFNFYAMGDMDRMREVCDQWFNKPSGFAVEIEPALPFVVVTAVYYPRAWSAQYDPAENGYMSYRELILSIYVREKQRFFGARSQIYGFMPFLWLDKARAIVAGREAFGLPKAYGTIGFPDASDPKNNCFSVKTSVPKKFGDPFSQAREAEIFRIKCPSHFTTQKYLDATGPGMKALVDHVYDKLNRSAEVSFDHARMLTHYNQIPSITMFQLRDTVNPGRALHQSIIEYATQDITLAFGGALNYDFELDFPEESEMFPIRRSLGLGKQVLAAYWFRMNFDFVLVRELWNAKNKRRRRRFSF